MVQFGPKSVKRTVVIVESVHNSNLTALLPSRSTLSAVRLFVGRNVPFFGSPDRLKHICPRT